MTKAREFMDGAIAECRKHGEFYIIVPGPPPRKNARGSITTAGGPRRITPKATREWLRRFDAAWMDALMTKPTTLAKRGRWCVAIAIHESWMSHLDVDVPLGDVDSSVSTILDALQRVKWTPLDDDARVVRLFVEKHYDKSNPRVEIVLTEVP